MRLTHDPDAFTRLIVIDKTNTSSYAGRTYTQILFQIELDGVLLGWVSDHGPSSARETPTTLPINVHPDSHPWQYRFINQRWELARWYATRDDAITALFAHRSGYRLPPEVLPSFAPSHLEQRRRKWPDTFPPLKKDRPAAKVLPFTRPAPVLPEALPEGFEPYPEGDLASILNVTRIVRAQGERRRNRRRDED